MTFLQLLSINSRTAGITDKDFKTAVSGPDNGADAGVAGHLALGSNVL